MIKIIPINIYALTRISKIAAIQKMEKQMSKRTRSLNIKKWEIQSLKDFSQRLKDEKKDTVNMNFYYSFQIPKLGKEFDLLRISDDFVVNIELKSREVSEENIKKQLLQNRYYLASLGKTVRSYTYISSTDRLVRLTRSNKLIESEWSRLCEDLLRQETCYEDDIEKLFKEEKYLISPFTDPERFLSREYFLTFQQKDIKSHILKNVHSKGNLFQGFTGLPGTGKTLLLYDMALVLSERQKVCVLHFGSFPVEMEHINKRLKRVDFYRCENCGQLPSFDRYSVIFVDEGHQLSQEVLEKIKEYAVKKNIPVIFSYDLEEAVSKLENPEDIVKSIKALPFFKEYRLTNRIRMNSELSSFIHCMMNVTKYHKRGEYPSVSLGFSNNLEEAANLLDYYIQKGYTYIYDESLPLVDTKAVKASVGICKEFEAVVMLMDSSFKYDNEGYLRSSDAVSTDRSVVRNLFHGLNRAKNKIAVVVLENESVFEILLSILQRTKDIA